MSNPFEEYARRQDAESAAMDREARAQDYHVVQVSERRYGVIRVASRFAPHGPSRPALLRFHFVAGLERVGYATAVDTACNLNAGLSKPEVHDEGEGP